MTQIRHNPGATPVYECLACGAIVESEVRPKECETCGRFDSLRDRSYTRE